MTKKQKTFAAIIEAAKSPDLAKQGSCAYVGYEGKHCIVGQVLSNLGVSDETLICELNGLDNKNSTSISRRADLNSYIESHGLDLSLLVEAQDAFDNESFKVDYYTYGCT